MAFTPLPRAPGGFRLILADPPWAYSSYSKPNGTTPHRSADEPYETVSRTELATLPVAEIAAKDCVLLLWTISSHLEQAFPLAAAWGFTYKSKAFEWLKTTKDGAGFKMGMGFWTRQESETVLLFSRGSPSRSSKGVRSTIYSPPRGHSQKPDEIYDRVETLIDGPYCELFARQRRPGWSSWGDQLPDHAEEARDQLTYWLDLVGVDEDKHGYRICDKSHPAVMVTQRTSNWPYIHRSETWPYCDETCIPF